MCLGWLSCWNMKLVPIRCFPYTLLYRVIVLYSKLKSDTLSDNSVLIKSPTQLAKTHSQTLTEPPLCFPDGRRHSLQTESETFRSCVIPLSPLNGFCPWRTENESTKSFCISLSDAFDLLKIVFRPSGLSYAWTVSSNFQLTGLWKSPCWCKIPAKCLSSCVFLWIF